MYWQKQTADASVCSGILGWKPSSISASREGEIQLKDLEKILSGELCLLQLQMRCSPASYCFPLGFVYVCVSVFRDCEVRGRVIKSNFPRLEN